MMLRPPAGRLVDRGPARAGTLSCRRNGPVTRSARWRGC